MLAFRSVLKEKLRYWVSDCGKEKLKFLVDGLKVENYTVCLIGNCTALLGAIRISTHR